MKRLARFILLSAAAVALAGCGSGAARAEVGAQAPAISLPDITGRQVALADFRGKVILLNFWALWCEPCKAEMPEFQAALDRYGSEGFAVITVDLGDQPQKVAAFMKEGGFTFTALVDSSLTLRRAYDTRILPLSLLLDRQGLIRTIQVTPFDPGQLPAQIETLVSEGA